MDLFEAIALYLDAQESHFKTPATIAYYTWELRRFQLHVGAHGIGTVEELTPEVIDAYLLHERRRGLKDTSVHASARAIRAFCLFLVKRGILSTSPMAAVEMPKLGRRILPALSPETFKRIMDACLIQRDRAIVVMMLDSGVRASELVNLNVADVDLASGMIYVREGKGRKDRHTFVNEQSREHLRLYLAERGALQPTDPLFVSQNDGKRLTRGGLQMMIRRLAQRSGVKVSPHAFRRTCAVTMHRSGAQVTEIAGILGHEDLPTLQRYLDLQAADWAEAHRRHSPVAAFLGS